MKSENSDVGELRQAAQPASDSTALPGGMIEIVVDHKVADVLAEKAAGNFDAVFIAIGAGVGKHVDIPKRDARRTEIQRFGLAQRICAFS